MRALLQRVSEARVSVGAERIAQIGKGLLVLVGVYPDDGTGQIEWLANRILDLRIFPDADKAMNRSLLEVDGSLLVISQFTLAADLSRGRRPGFSTAASPSVAEPVFEQFVASLRKRCPTVQTGRFGADMQVALVNDGPVTFLLER